MAETLSELVDAYEHTIRASLALSRGMSDDDWRRPTWLPGWTVADNIAHIAALERQFLGEGDSDHVLPPLPHVTNAIQEHMERGVDARRGWTRNRVIDDLSGALEARLAVLRDPATTDETLVPGLMGGETPVGRSLPIRVFDLWAHEQDVRAAIGSPGNVDSPAAAVSFASMQRMGAGIAKAAELSDGDAARIDVTGPIALSVAIGDGPARATITCDGHALYRLVAGRGDWRDVPVSITGDAELAARVLAHAALTP